MRKLTTFLMFFLFSVSQVWAQTRTITGKVTDEKGAAVAGATVKANGSTKATSTGTDGTFSLTVPQNVKSVTISGIGLTTQTVTIPSSGSIIASMAVARDVIEEVVVQVPYGSIKENKFTGSQSTISSKQIERSPVTSITKALEGLTPGVQTTNGGGAPGSNAAIRVRGIGSINASSAPLYVLNGALLDDNTATLTVGALSPDEVESVTVLKDAAAAALYGSRSANGVIMITTKKGKKGKANINLRASNGFLTRGIPEYDRLNQKDYYEMMWEATRNSYQYGASQLSAAAAGVRASDELTDGSHLVYNAYNVPGNQLVSPTTGKLNPNAKLLWDESWEKALFRTAQRKNVGVTISGAGDRNDYLIAFGYLDEEGTMSNTGYKRYNARLNVNSAANNWLSVGLNIDGSYGDRKTVTASGTATSNPFYFTRQMGPIYPVYQHNLTTGALVIDPTTGQPAFDFGIPAQMGTRPYAPNSNLAATLALDDRNSKELNANANTYLDAKITKELSFKTSLGINFYDRYATTYQNSKYGDAANVNGRTTKGTIRQTSMTLNEVLTWKKDYGKHSISALAGHENYKYQIDQASATGIGYAFVNFYELGVATTPEDVSSQFDKHTIESYFTGVNYDFDKKYLFSANIRRDGNSRFRPDLRWNNFYSFGAGWVISEETFLKKASWINSLKLKASYGQQGNEAVGSYYVYYNNYSLGLPNAGFSGGFPQLTAPSPATWENSKNFNVGLDFNLFNRKVQGSIEYFDRISDGLLFVVTLPNSTGLSSVLKNAATMYNRGIELQLGYNAITTKSFDWRVDFNITSYTNKITQMPVEYKDGFTSGTKRYIAGRSVFDYYMREFAGVDAATGDALYYKDVLDATGKATGQRTITNSYNGATQYFIGVSAIPKFSGGLTNSFRYKSFEFSFLLTFSYGGKFYDGNYQSIMHFGSYGTAWSKDILNRWQKPGDITNVPKVQNAVADQDGTSSRFLFDASYLNLRNVTLSYSIPKATISKMHLNGLQVYMNIDNAWLWTAKKGGNPQTSFSGTTDATYPPFRTVNFGVNVNL